MKTITLEELLEAGCHFGHQVTRHNPKSRDYVFEARDNIHIIDLVKTKEGLETAGNFLRDLAKKNGTLLIVGTKRQAQPIIEEEVKRVKEAVTDKDAGVYYITKRWIGGTMTNFPEIEKNIRKLKELTQRLQSEDERAKYTKKELGLLDKERQKLESFYSGIMDMKKQPTGIYIIDTHAEKLAVREATQNHVPTIGIVDTNADPTIINYPIPANDDAVGSIKIITTYLLDAWIEGRTIDASKNEKKEEPKTEKKAKSVKEESEAKEVQDTTEQSPVKTEEKKKKK